MITWSKDLANGSCDALAENESERVEEEEISGCGSVGAAAACSSSNQLNKDGGRQEQVRYNICYIQFGTAGNSNRLCDDLIFAGCQKVWHTRMFPGNAI